MSIAVDVDISRLGSNMSRRSKKTERELKNSILDLATHGVSKAHSLVPRQTGLLASGIVFKQLSQGLSAEIRSRDVTSEYPGEPKSRRMSNFSLPRWMAESPNAPGHVKSGRARYMDLTRQSIQRRAPAELRKRIKLITS